MTYSGIAERDFVPVGIIETGAVISMAIIAAGVLYKYTVWKRSIPSGLFADAARSLGLRTLIGLFFSELGSRVALQKDVITDSRVRWATHQMIFWGFWGLAFATTWTYIFYRDGTPRPLADPGKLVGNVGGALVLIGCTMILLRYTLFEKYRRGARSDVAFFSMLYLSTLTGFASETVRLTSNSFALNSIYALHLIFIVGLLVTAPFTHFLHALLVPFERYVGRIHAALLEKGATPLSDYRRTAMIEAAARIKDRHEAPVYPAWLRRKRRSSD